MSAIVRRLCRCASLSALAALLAACSSEVESAVKDYLTDPDSAKFSEIATKDGVTCGVVNARNRMGGYTGPRTFLYKDGQVHFLGEAAFNEIGFGACSNRALGVAIQENAEAISRE